MPEFADTRLPAHGLDAGAVLARLDELAANDRDWRGGRVFSLVYNAGDEVLDLLARAAGRYSAENALNTMAFPSLGWMQHDIVTITAGLLGADRRPPGAGRARGYLTSGGTESLLQATRTARDWGRAERGIDTPNMVLATSAHAAFEPTTSTSSRGGCRSGPTAVPTSGPWPRPWTTAPSWSSAPPRRTHRG